MQGSTKIALMCAGLALVALFTSHARASARNPDAAQATKKNTKRITYNEALDYLPKTEVEARQTLQSLQINKRARNKESGQIVYLKGFRKPEGHKPHKYGLQVLGAALRRQLIVEVGSNEWTDADLEFVAIEDLTFD